MLGPLIEIGARYGARYLFFRRWGRLLAVAVVVLICAIAAVLVDARMYWSAGLVGIVGAMLLTFFLVQSIRNHGKNKRRERERLEEAKRRAEAAQARREKMEEMRETFTSSARTATENVASRAKSSIAGARDRFGSWRTPKQ